MFSIAVLLHSPGVVYYHLLLRRETRIPGVAPYSFQIGIWDLFVHRGQKSYTPTAFRKLWTTPGVRCIEMPHHNQRPWYETGPRIEPGTFGLADECSTTELTLLLFCGACILVCKGQWDFLILASAAPPQYLKAVYLYPHFIPKYPPPPTFRVDRPATWGLKHSTTEPESSVIRLAVRPGR